MIDIEVTNIKNSLEKLTAASTPRWGNMTPIQMLDHLVYSVKVGNGEIPSPTIPTDEKAEKFQKFLASDHPMPRDFKAKFAEISILNPSIQDITDGKRQLIDTIEKFIELKNIDPSRKVMNPEFGLLSLEQWERLHSKHFSHHFEQFSI